ncbi:MAG: DUF368 domain-containing protein [Defluviitaleaceae bacterium]|nr:DUF368 domain-containing protein [Defluviitaleaceae bacterium]
MIINFIKGIVIGLALVIPGFSASTFAVATGLYDKIIFAANNLRKEFKKSMIFLMPIGIGAAIGILASVGVILSIMEAFPLQSYAFFIGLVIGSVPMIYSKIKPERHKKPNYALAVVGFAVIVALSFMASSDEVVAIYAIQSPGNFIAILTAGIISCFLLAIPGVSGALMLILLGQYGTVYNAVGNFADVAVMIIRGEEGAVGLGLESGAIVLTFFVGALIGLAAAAKIIGYLIERFETKVYFVVLGLVLGAVVTLFNFGVADQFAHLSPTLILNAVLLLVFAAAGYICTKFMGSKG